MFAFAAHTGARRSEMVRSRLNDIDLAAGVITIHERKRNQSMRTTRRVPISPVLATVLRDWLAQHPGGVSTFVLAGEISRSRKERTGIIPLTRDEAHDHFKRTLAGSKWERLRGWHVFRHSFCSNCAAAGIDQRIINAWVGHQTEDMVRRYRHLIPNQQQEAIQRVFGAA
jgi:integrase